MPRFADIRDAVLLSGAVLLGGVFAPTLPMVGLPIAAAGLAALVYRGRPTVATFAAGMTVAFGAFVHLPDVVFLAPTFVALLVIIGGMRNRSPLVAIVPLTAVVALGSIGSTVVYATLRGETFLAFMKERTDAAVEAFVTTAGGVGADGTIAGVEPEMLADLMYRLWPADYFTTALLGAALAVVAAGWAANRVGAEVRRLPRLDVLDLSPHVIWPFIAAFALLAAARIVEDPQGIVTGAGLNLLIGVRMLLLAQGMGVVSSFYRRIGLGVLARRTGYVLLLIVDAVLPVVSMVGLIDFWANFRKLPRDDSSSAERLERDVSGD